MLEALVFADKLLGLVPTVIAAGGDVLTIIAQGRAALEKMKTESRGPTIEEWDALNQSIDTLMGQLK